MYSVRNKDDWEELMGNDLLKKTISISSPDSTNVVVQAQDVVVIDFIGRLAPAPSQEDGRVFQTAKNWMVVIGEKDVLPALEMGIRFMSQGETAVVWGHSKFAYGPFERQVGAYTLPADSNVRYEVTLRRVVPEAETKQHEFQLMLCQSRKQIGNDIYEHDVIRSSDYARGRALATYQRASDMLDCILQQQQTKSDEGEEMDDKLTEETRDCLLDCLNNTAAVHLRCCSYHEAKEACVKVLEKRPTNFKALIRAAKAALLDPASTYEEVSLAIDRASEQCEDNQSLRSDVEKLRKQILRRKNLHKMREKEMYAKMGRAAVSRSVRDNVAATFQADVGEAKEKRRARMRKVFRWSTVFAYALQLILPFVMYYCFSIMRRDGQDSVANLRNIDEL